MVSIPDGIEVHRNRLPQWRLAEGIYAVTWCLLLRDKPLTSDERTIVANAIKFHKDQRYRLAIFVVMDDHVHVLLQTLPGHNLSDILRGLKGFTANQINRLRGTKGAVWQKDSYTELMRNQAAIDSRMQYFFDNPRRRWGIEPHTYEWLEWFR